MMMGKCFELTNQNIINVSHEYGYGRLTPKLLSYFQVDIIIGFNRQIRY